MRVSDKLDSTWGLGVTGRRVLEIRGTAVAFLNFLLRIHSYQCHRLPRSLDGGNQSHPRMLPPHGCRDSSFIGGSRGGGKTRCPRG